MRLLSILEDTFSFSCSFRCTVLHQTFRKGNSLSGLDIVQNKHQYLQSTGFTLNKCKMLDIFGHFNLFPGWSFLIYSRCFGKLFSWACGDPENGPCSTYSMESSPIHMTNSCFKWWFVKQATSVLLSSLHDKAHWLVSTRVNKFLNIFNDSDSWCSGLTLRMVTDDRCLSNKTKLWQ